MKIVMKGIAHEGEEIGAERVGKELHITVGREFVMKLACFETVEFIIPDALLKR